MCPVEDDEDSDQPAESSCVVLHDPLRYYLPLGEEGQHGRALPMAPCVPSSSTAAMSTPARGVTGWPGHIGGRGRRVGYRPQKRVGVRGVVEEGGVRTTGPQA